MRVRPRSLGSWGMMWTVLALFLRWPVAAMKLGIKESGNKTNINAI